MSTWIHMFAANDAPEVTVSVVAPAETPPFSVVFGLAAVPVVV